jgi:hypothetical protein
MDGTGVLAEPLGAVLLLAVLLFAVCEGARKASHLTTSQSQWKNWTLALQPEEQQLEFINQTGREHGIIPIFIHVRGNDG